MSSQFGVPKAPFSRELVFALDICERAGRIAMEFFGCCGDVASKADGSPVTIADKKCERLIREAINARYPDDGILGEEEGETAAKGQSGRRWIIDPIDGTYNYARGVPIFATLLALESEGEVVLGVVHNPAFADTFWAEKGSGAFKNGSRIHVSAIGSISESQFNFGSPARILAHGLWDGFEQIVFKTARQRGFGDYYGFALVFEGKAEAMLEVGVSPWDLAPMKILVEESGGRFTDLSGSDSIYTGSCLISNGHVHEQFLAYVRK
ncbi:MAG TPA: inositol monophosphatase family protein [Candidatus Obscuribacterales bacterium]